MRNGEKRGVPADGREAPGGAAVQLQARGTAAPDHFDVAPQHTLGVTGAEGLHRRFLCREASGKMNGRHAPARAVRDFDVGEDAAQKTFAVPLDDVGDAIDVGRVESEANDVHAPSA
jgi:hypothetical protein